MKKCSKCGLKKEKGEFCNSIHRKDGLMSCCRICESERKKIYRENNRDKIKNKKDRFYQENKENILKKQKEYFLENEDRIKQRKKEYYLKNLDYIKNKVREYKNENKEKYLEYSRNYFKFNKEKHNERSKKYNKKKRQDDIAFRLKCRISCTINYYLKKNDSKKDFPTWSKLPYTPTELKEHLEKQFDENMNWENYGIYWSIDHIIPQSKLLYDSLEHLNFQKCWELFNLRPLSIIENSKKGNRILGE